MAILTIDSKNLELTLKVGILEEYTPTQEMKDIYNSTKDLKNKTDVRIKEIVGDIKDQSAAVDLLEKDAEKQEEWKKFLENEYNVVLAKIIESIRTINKKICPDYERFINSN